MVVLDQKSKPVVTGTNGVSSYIPGGIVELLNKNGCGIIARNIVEPNQAG